VVRIFRYSEKSRLSDEDRSPVEDAALAVVPEVVVPKAPTAEIVMTVS
jgi:hypothetical protein